MDLGRTESMGAASKRVQRKNLLNALLAELKRDKPEPQISEEELLTISQWFEMDLSKKVMEQLLKREENAWATLLFELFDAGVDGETIQKFLESESTPLGFRYCLVAQTDRYMKKNSFLTDHICQFAEKQYQRNDKDRGTLIFIRPSEVFVKKIP